MQVRRDQQTSAKYRSRLWFGLDKQLSSLVLKFNFILQTGAVPGGRILNSPPSAIFARCVLFFEEYYL